MLLPFSLKAKQHFLSSALLIESLKEANSVVELRLVRESKDKKKKDKIHSLQAKESQVMLNAFDLLCALFYWKGEGHLEGGEGLRKAVRFL